MALTLAQQQTLKAAIAADGTLNTYPLNSSGAFDIAVLINQVAVPDFIVWRTDVKESEVTGNTSAEATTWDWTAYISRSQGERDGWGRMFGISGTLDASKVNVRQGMADIFSGGTGVAQRAHLLAIAKRKASRFEQWLATGTGSLASPATMGVEGPIGYQEVEAARNLP